MTWNAGAHAPVIVKHKPSRQLSRRNPHPPQDRLAGAAVLKRDHVADLMANVDIHFIRHAQGELDGGLLVRLRAHHAPMLVVDGEAVLGTPLRHLRESQPSARHSPGNPPASHPLSEQAVFTPEFPPAKKSSEKEQEGVRTVNVRFPDEKAGKNKRQNTHMFLTSAVFLKNKHDTNLCMNCYFLSGYGKPP